MELKFPKLYRYDREREHCSVALAFAKGELTEPERVQIFEEGRQMPVQAKVTSRYGDGSIRYLFVRFLADLPGNEKAVLECRTDSEERIDYQGLRVNPTENGYRIDGGVSFQVSHGAAGLFDWLEDGRKRYEAGQFVGPVLQDGEGCQYGIRLDTWRVMESGPLVAVLRCTGHCVGARSVTFEVKLMAYAEKPWVEIAYRIINSTEEPLHVASLVFAVMADGDVVYAPALSGAEGIQEGIYETLGTKELAGIEAEIGRDGVRTCVGNSNYKTKFRIGRDGQAVTRIVDSRYLTGEANEHMSEVFYGTFFADRTDDRDGVCATIYQAQQNYPKAVRADGSGVYVMLVPEGVDRVVMASGMSREQKFLLHFHDVEEPLTSLDNRSTIYQMPDRCSVPGEVFGHAGVMPDIFVRRDQADNGVELALIGKCDGHGRSFGMMNWGDYPDSGYTAQGRGGGRQVWSNNEYDYPHACALLYARTGERRFMDYMAVAASHWMDVDVCHYSSDPLLYGGQWEHTAGHCQDGVILCSHEWVEGLLDCYHFTGEERALETAIGIGENVLRLLDTPMYQESGESSARETGWALRTLVALYRETSEDRWLEKCRGILAQFRDWQEEYGGWIYPYMDNVTIRVPFMISVAVSSIMHYYRIFPQQELKTMMLTAVDDLVENCLMENGVFCYKELPSLNKINGNVLILEALTIAYELTGDTGYLEYGRRTFMNSIKAPAPSAGGGRVVAEDAVLYRGAGTKGFAQSFIPLSVFYKALADNHML